MSCMRFNPPTHWTHLRVYLATAINARLHQHVCLCILRAHILCVCVRASGYNSMHGLQTSIHPHAIAYLSLLWKDM